MRTIALLAGLMTVFSTAIAAPEKRDAQAPREAVVDASPAVVNGISFLESRIADEPAALAFAHFLHRRWGLQSFAGASDAYEALLERRPEKGSPDPGAIRMFRRLIVVDNPFDPDDISALNAPWDKLTVLALYCDRVALPPDYGERLELAAAKGGYSLTHAGMAVMWLRDNGCSVPVEKATVDEWAAQMARLLEPREAGDIPFEAAGVLEYLGYDALVPEDYLRTIVEAQNPDGGWGFDDARPGSHWHPTLLALWAILERVSNSGTKPFVPQPEDLPNVQEEAKSEDSGSLRWEAMTAREERLLDLTPSLHALARSITNLELPGDRARPLFGNSVDVVDIAEIGAPSPWLSGTSGTVREFSTAPRAHVARQGLDLWAPAFTDVDRFDHASFRMVRGDFVAGRDDLYRADVKFEAKAILDDDRQAWLRGRIRVFWERADDEIWRIVRWETGSLERIDTPGTFFREVLAGAVRGSETRARVRGSGHDEEVRRYLADPERKTRNYFPPAMDRHPGVAVVDIDRDGRDDLYLIPHWGRNLLLRNRGDGTFEDIAHRIGLDLDDSSTAALFADFDNDGDPDAFIARTHEPSLYLQNENGRFVDASSEVSGRLPSLTSSVSAADVDGDGLLDVYLSTYAARRLTQEFVLDKTGEAPLLQGFVSRTQSAKIREKLAGGAEVFDFPGPPNVFLRNVGGGRFEVDSESPLSVLVNTYQATWSDFDGDDDPDVYLANDFSANHLFRNDGENGFVDVTAETGTADVGFGMGVTWGDVDGDAREDLYVSNMYSKAGSRIAAQLGEIDPRFAKMARGNTLFRNEEGVRFEDLSTRPGERHAQKAGWSWGGQFADVDNDGRSDLHVLSGYYTAPREFELPVDT